MRPLQFNNRVALSSCNRPCYVLQSRSGNLLSSQHIPNIFSNGQYCNSFGALLDLELGAQRNRLTYSSESSDDMVFTEYQSQLWASISSGANVAISAPTSAGKSFIIRQHIVKKLLSEVSVAIYVVPTKALINQVSTEFKVELQDQGHVYTTYRPLEKLSKSTVFVLTPERCMKLVLDGKLSSPAVVFFDEIHNLEDAGRGLVFENAIYRLMAKHPKSQFIFAGPFIEDVVKPLRQLSDLEIIDETTISTPVFQIKAAITFKPRSKVATYRIFSQTGSIITGEMHLKKALYAKAKKNQGEAVASFLDTLNSRGSCIIFAPRKNSAEKWALKASPIVGMSNPDITQGADQSVIDLIDFLAEEIHPEYSLIRTLRMGVAFHHAGLPDIARIEIEELYSRNIIKNLVCTSTLIQGVNLPADKLIVINPANDKTPLSSFEFMNLIGRAGRVSTNLYGEVYCLDIENAEWAGKRLLEQTKKNIKTSTISILEENTQSIIDLIRLSRNEITQVGDGRKLYVTICYLRHLYKSDTTHFERLLAAADIPISQAEILKRNLQEIMSGLEIPDHLLQQNPYIDPLLQDALYIRIKEEGVSNWLPNKFPSRKNSYDIGNLESQFFQDFDFYKQFESIAVRLNEIFAIEDEVNHGRFADYVGIKSLVYDAYQWMTGKTHRHFIDLYIEKHKSTQVIEASDSEDTPESKVDKAARYVTGHISRDITFILVKFFSLWSDTVRSFLTEEEQEKYAYALSLPSMIELGSYDPKVLELISLGINRSIALKLRRSMPKELVDIEGWLRTLNTSRFPPLFSRYLARSGLVNKPES